MKSITNVKIKRWYQIFCLFGIFVFTVASSYANVPDGNPKGGVKTVVIDAGHGGKDPGALGKITREKDIALSVALKLGEQIQKSYPDVKVVYTRKTDTFIELHNRAKIANENNADLFISIHCNSIENNPNVNGSETFVLGLHRNKENLEIAKRENASILLEDDYKSNYEGYDPNSEVGHILLSMMQNNYLDKSISFASKIEGNMSSTTKTKSRGVKQAGFLVLRQTFMPSVLIEAGFLSNQNDEQYLASSAGQDQVANSIFKAFASYKAEMDKDQTSLVYTDHKPKTIENSSVKPAVTKETVIVSETTVTTEPRKVSTSTTGASNEMPSYAQTGKVTQTTTSSTTRTVSTKPTSPEPKVVATTTTTTQTTQVPVTTKYQANPSVVTSNDVEYTVQVAAASKKGDLSGKKWSKYQDQLMIRYENNAYKYQVGSFKRLSDAEAKKAEVRRNGFTDAFVVAYKDGKKVNLNSLSGYAAN